jgi:excisionase family DNA binding protein
MMTDQAAPTHHPEGSCAPDVAHPDAGRFLTIPQLAEELATSEVQVTAMLRRGDMRAIKLGGRGQWRIERAELEAYIQAAVRGDTTRSAGPRPGGRVTLFGPRLSAALLALHSV